jgi:hypothetical protein
VVLARKGDVFLWHGALAHSGSPSKDPERTRRAFVVHYSTPQAYPCDRRAPGQPPRRQAHGGGWVYENPLLPGEEDVFRRGAEVGPGSMPLSSS